MVHYFCKPPISVHNLFSAKGETTPDMSSFIHAFFNSLILIDNIPMTTIFLFWLQFEISPKYLYLLPVIFIDYLKITDYGNFFTLHTIYTIYPTYTCYNILQ